MARYHAPQPAPASGAVVSDTLEAVAREGARRMLERALEVEVDAFLGRDRYALGGRETGYRNGHGRPREIGIGTWSVEVRPPRVSDLRAGSEPFASALLPRRRYFSRETQRLFARLYLEGLSSGDFEPAFRGLLGACVGNASRETSSLVEARLGSPVGLYPHHLPCLWA